MSIYKLSNLLLSHIITEIEDNVDIICLLLTCKKLYNNSSLKRSIQFKGIEVIDKYRAERSFKFIKTVNRFKLNSFKDILVNSATNQHIIVPDQFVHNDYPKWIQDHIYEENMVDKSNIKTAFVCPHTSLKSLTLKTLSISDLGSMQLNQLVSLTELTFHHKVTNLGSGLFPNSLTSLTITLIEIPPRDTFNSLKCLVKLEINMENEDVGEQQQQQQFIDLYNLPNLKTFKFIEYQIQRIDFIEIRLPPSLKILHLLADYLQIPSQCSTPMLERLYVNQCLLINGKFNLMSSPSIKKLSISKCNQIIPAAIIIPSSVEKLTIKKVGDQQIFGQVVLPPALTHLSINGINCESVQPLPESLVKLKQTINESPVSLPQHLEKLVIKIKATNKLDSDNKNVLVLERQMLLGGIITQRKSITNQEKYDPIYLYLDGRSSKFHWSFNV
ncbi:hypothetical protein DFA_02392 [Cavenderia fasciculata]|uniref:Uncharacterized protein n=1 Tax=Cavenderia fasciculata TaxID=261658 RepID=F4PZB6_CACFS|nr:uncharacterized protein DFA_02392 [Cavenderia fasciculata]EGG19145.1 hypothetical protein DFA_02392 [Cavenderia fasciculata]|eukprot:XP_004366778.1 hypothetical protein DFA_02392 [Cavenderia fasciculata]